MTAMHITAHSRPRIAWILLPFILVASFIYSDMAIEKEENKYKLAVCAVFQNEDFFLKEWLEFHKLMGVEHFYLYNNLSTDSYQEILSPYIKAGVVSLVDWPVESHNQQEYLNLLQLPVYNHALEIAKHEAEWIAFIDLDEFLFPIHHSNLIALLENYRSFAGLAVNWQLYGTSWLQNLPDNGLIIENLILKAPTDYHSNQIIKMIVQPTYVKTIDNPHFFKYYKGCYAVDSAGRILPDGVAGQPVNVETVRINHYWCGTYEWLINQKMSRRKKWGLSIPDDLLSAIVKSYNQVQDDSIRRFAPELKKSMSLAK